MEKYINKIDALVYDEARWKLGVIMADTVSIWSFANRT